MVPNPDASSSFFNGVTAKTHAIRPLGALSHYVCDELPKARSTLAQAARLIPDQKALHALDDDVARVALLDLKMLFVAATVRGTQSKTRGAFAEAVGTMNEILERPQVLQMTYEDIVLNNPASDMRIFTRGRTGVAEAGFYHGHQYMEAALSTAITAMQTAIQKPEEASLALEVALKACKRVTSTMLRFATDLKPDDFLGFKPYFNTNKYTQEKGPSGAFSARIPHVDILLFGPDVPEEAIAYIRNNQRYFPGKGHADLLQDYASGRSVLQTMHRSSRELAYALGMEMDRFRRAHTSAVKVQIGPNAIGSAEGVYAMQFLRNRREHYKAALAQYAL